MFNRSLVACVLLLAGPSLSALQATKVPLGDGLRKALDQSTLTGLDARPFHMRAVVSEPGFPDSPYQGTIEEWWFSANNWRREVTDRAGVHQTIVVSNGAKTERDEGDYFPLWLRNFVTGLIERVPEADTTWGAANLTIDQVSSASMGLKSDACVRIKSKLGTGNRATDAFSVLCFDDVRRVKSIVSPRYHMSFDDYSGFGSKQIPNALHSNPEPGTALLAKIETIEELSQADAGNLLVPLPQNDSRFDSVETSSEQMEQLTAANASLTWPALHAGRTSGNLAMYVSADARGHIREAWPLNSDNAGLNDIARDQVRKWTIPLAKNAAGNPVQIDGGLGFFFQTVIVDPAPELTDKEARRLLISSVAPRIPQGAAPSGTRYSLRIGVDEQGQVNTGVGGDTEIPGTVKLAGAPFLPVLQAVWQWRFKPLMRNGKPTSFFTELIITIP